ncbi:MAG: S41 family peptidase [bacterium]|nr:S41 family peptidase [bacterium]
MFPEEQKQNAFRMRGTIVAGIILVSCGFAVGVFVGGHLRGGAVFASGSAIPDDVDMSPVWKAWHVIDDKFVPASVATSSPVATTTAEINQKRVYGMIEGLAASLNDPYTFFLPPVENQMFTSDMNGSFEGVGMEIAIKNQVLTVVSPLKGSPAEAAGLKSGDHILKIDDADTKGIDVVAAVKQIRGPKGTKVALLILREEWSEPREIKVTRDVINVPIITTTAREDGIFVIEIQSFTSSSPDLFRIALREFIESGATKLILDLRGNPGGYLDAAVSMASWFLPAGNIVVTEDYAGHAPNVVHRSLGYNVFNKNLRVVILVDNGSASASEILADALRYYGVAQLVGVNTFGKGSVQELVDITPNTALKITVARWLGPDKKHIPITGIVPDIEVKKTDEDIEAKRDPQLNKAVEMLHL